MIQYKATSRGFISDCGRFEIDAALNEARVERWSLVDWYGVNQPMPTHYLCLSYIAAKDLAEHLLKGGRLLERL